MTRVIVVGLLALGLAQAGVVRSTAKGTKAVAVKSVQVVKATGRFAWKVLY